MEFIKKDISAGIELVGIPVDRFKTNLITVSLALPLERESVSANAVMLGLLARRGAKYRDMLSLNRKLASLYGATLNETVSKIGECQVLSLSSTCLNDRFSLDGESIAFECVKLLSSLIFDAKLDENGMFFDEDIEAEKRILTEKLNSEENEKRIYVLRKTEEKMFENEPYSVNKYGTKEQVASLNKADLKNAWQNALSKAKVLITVVGNTDIDKAYDYLKGEFEKVERNYTSLPEPVFVGKSEKVNNHLERIDVKQGKLVLGFRVDVKPNDNLAKAMRSFSDIFGGGPYSKLFANVREKMSLCYYCSARYTRLKSCILVQCGCLEENMDKAIDEILNQLDVIKSGDYKEEFESSKMALGDAVMSISDMPETIESWYIGQITDNRYKTPEEVCEEIKSVKYDEIKKCAGLVSLDTVYKLVGEEE